VPAHYIFDANFFISINQVYRKPIIGAIAKAVDDQGAKPHVTHLILGEIGTLRYDNRKKVADNVTKFFDVAHIDNLQIEALESKVGKERSPQHPDLSLMVLANKLGKNEDTVLVSDDFKIHTTQVRYNLRFKVISPSAFLLDVSNSAEDKDLRKTFRRLYRQVRRKEMEYMLSRRDTYNVEPKLTWLIDNLLGSGPGVSTRASKQPRVVPITDRLELDLAPIYRHIDGEKVRSSKLTPFENIMPYIDFLKESKGVEEEVRLHVDQGEFKGALQVVRTASSRLSRKLQEASMFVDVMDGLKLRQVFAHYLAHYNFMQAFLSLSIGKVLNAEEYLDSAGFCALVTKDNDDIVKASYIKSLLYFNMEEFGEATEQFGTTERIARTLGMHETEFWAVFGKSISMFLMGDEDGAEVSMIDVHNMVEEFGRETTHALLTFADHLQNFGRAEVAIAVYSEALESALEWGQTDMMHTISESMKHCTATLAHVGAVLDSNLSHLIDKAHDLCEECQEAYFKEVQDIVLQEAEILKPLDLKVKEWTMGKDLPNVYRGWMEVVRFIPMRDISDKASIKHTLVLGYVPEVGNLGIYLKGTRDHSNLERYMVRLGDDGTFKVLDAPEHYRRRYGVRGVVGVKDSTKIEFKHLMAASLLREDLEDQSG